MTGLGEFIPIACSNLAAESACHFRLRGFPLFIDSAIKRHDKAVGVGRSMRMFVNPAFASALENPLTRWSNLWWTYGCVIFSGLTN